MNEKIPDRWSIYPLKDICYFQEGPGLRNWQYKKPGIKFLNIRCIKDGKVDLSVAQSVAKEEVNNKYKHFLLDANDYVLSSSGTLGRLAKIDASNLPLLLNTSIIRFRSSNENVLDHLFLRYFLQSKYFFDKISEQSQGSAQLNVGPTHLKLLNVILPTLPEQKKIGRILASTDEVIEKTQSHINKFQDLIKSVTDELLTKGIGHTEFKDSELGRIPKNWKVYAIEQLSEVVGGGTPASKTLEYWGGTVMWATPTDITKLKGRYINKTVKTLTEEGLENSSAKLHPTGTILLTSRASIGFSAITLLPMATNQGFQSLRPNENLDIEYGYQVLLHNKHNLERLSAGSTFLEISSKEIKKFKLPIPPLSEQKKIASILISMNNLIEKKERQLDKIQSLKKSLMQDLLTGKVRVSVN